VLWNSSLPAQGEQNKPVTWAEATEKSDLVPVKKSMLQYSWIFNLLIFSGFNHCIF